MVSFLRPALESGKSLLPTDLLSYHNAAAPETGNFPGLREHPLLCGAMIFVLSMRSAISTMRSCKRGSLKLRMAQPLSGSLKTGQVMSAPLRVRQRSTE